MTRGWLRLSVVAILSSAACFSPTAELISNGGSGGGADAGSITTELKSDASWRILGSVPPVGWNTDPDFDDNAWGWAVLQTPQGPQSNGASVWDGVTPGSGSLVVFMRRTFIVPGDLESAQLTVACNDDMEVWINGVRVLADDDGVTTTRTGLDMRALLVSGTNLLAASCRDVVGPEHSFHGWLVFTSR